MRVEYFCSWQAWDESEEFDFTDIVSILITDLQKIIRIAVFK